MTPGLIERLEGAGEGSRELDFWIAFELGALSGVVAERPSRVEPGPGDELTIYDASGKRAGWVGYHVSRPVTTSLDAALALAERVGWRLYKLDASIISRSSVMLQSVDDRPRVDPDSGATLMGKDFAVGSSKTPALALCIAILKARATQEQTHG